jgi:heat shock protein HslJ
MRPGPLCVLFSALILPSAGGITPAGAADEWRIARIWNPSTAKSTALSPDASAKSIVAVVPPGRLSLSVGCNDMSTKGLKQDGTALLEPAMATKMACPPELAALETALLGALKLIRSHERTGNEMILRDGDGKEVLALVR